MDRPRKSLRIAARFDRERVFVEMEWLESRRMLSATMTVHPNITVAPMASSGTFQGYTPSQIRHAYGFDQVAADGAGQTIAIVDAYYNPNIISDLKTFDQKFGIADPPSLKLVNQTGGPASSVATDSGWATEIALDVEWAHAIAPKANILLVSANSSDLTNLMTAVNYARQVPGVSAVSMSWGGSEFSGQTRYDKLFTTPAGHSGVTFVAASGDSGSGYGPEWPASSPNVLAVGGTSLYTSSAGGTYAGETGWSGSGGGISNYENEPAYQSGAQRTGGRTTPDVSYNANPNTGFAFYSSIADAGIVGWSIVGGTSAGAPQWAALVTLANQIRVSEGKGTLDGATGTLPALYGLYHRAGTTSYAAYASDFHDVSRGASSYFIGAHAGYDGVTGLGTPKAAEVVAALAGASTTSQTATARKSAVAASAVAKPAVAKPAMVTKAAQVAQASVSSNVVWESAAPNRTMLAVGTVNGSVFANAAVAREVLSTVVVLAPDVSLAAPISGTFRIAQPATAFTGALEASMPATNAMRTANATMTLAMAGIAELAGEASPGIPAAAMMIRQLDQINTIAGFADAMAEFAHESASLGQTLATGQSHATAWEVTFGVLAADAILIGYWWAGRRRKIRQEKVAASFSSKAIHF